MRNASHEFRKIALSAANQTPIHRTDARVKLILLIGFLIKLLWIPMMASYRFIGMGFIILAIGILGEVSLKRVLINALIVEPFLMIGASVNLWFNQTPVTLYGFHTTAGVLTMLFIMVRGYLMLVTVLVYAHVTPMHQMASGLKSFRIPDTLILIFMETYRYIILMVDTASQLMLAYRMRSGERSKVSREAYGSMMGQLFLIAYYKARQSYDAMRLRGFEGQYTLEKGRFNGVTDIGLVVVFAVVLWLI